MVGLDAGSGKADTPVVFTLGERAAADLPTGDRVQFRLYTQQGTNRNSRTDLVGFHPAEASQFEPYLLVDGCPQ